MENYLKNDFVQTVTFDDPDPSLRFRKNELLNSLILQPGIKRSEIVEELKSIDDIDCLDEDQLLFSIISKREGKERDFDDLKIREDKDLDNAIIESEKERENILIRKRARINELKSNFEIDLEDSDEFKSSILLNGLEVGKIHKNCQEFLNIYSNYYLGSIVIKSLIHFFNEFKNHKLFPLKKSEIIILRERLVKLLLLEADCLKYFGNISYPYLLSLIIKIDDELFIKIKKSKIKRKSSPPLKKRKKSSHKSIKATSIPSKVGNDSSSNHDQATSIQDIPGNVCWEDLFSISGKSCSSKRSRSDNVNKKNDLIKSDFAYLFTNSPGGVVSLLSASQKLKEITEFFEIELTSIPKDGSLVPEIFKSNNLQEISRFFQYSLEEDGFEIVE